jgi:hypothetical protein
MRNSREVGALLSWYFTSYKVQTFGTITFSPQSIKTILVKIHFPPENILETAARKIGIKAVSI